MDDVDHKIAMLLGQDARLSLAQIGAQVGLSTSAVNERIRRLSERGVLRRMMADVAAEQIGLPVAAFVWVALAPQADEPAFRLAMAEHRGVTACHHVTGPWSYLVQIRAPSLDGVEAFLSELKAGGWIARSETNLALSSVVEPPFRYRGMV
ncbi:Lrp/AsnC family transcriptional regulator [Sinirhodobacter sp. HNIBRBA609]|nr:Lrp/AsnC family transcriptional regulator [Sinirhodobacter sp. HNIBRBA609]